MDSRLKGKIWKSETNKDIKKHFKRYAYFENWKGVAPPRHAHLYLEFKMTVAGLILELEKYVGCQNLQK